MCPLRMDDASCIPKAAPWPLSPLCGEGGENKLTAAAHAHEWRRRRGVWSERLAEGINKRNACMRAIACQHVWALLLTQQHNALLLRA